MNRFLRYGLSTFFLLLFSLSASAITITHNMGTTQINSVPKRVVVIGTGALDTLDSFDIPVIGVAKGLPLPAYLNKYNAAKYANVGTLFEPDFETIYMLKPDLIIVGPRAQKHYKELTQIAPTIVFSSKKGDIDYWLAAQREWQKIGKVFNIQDKVTARIATLNKQFAAIKHYTQSHHLNALTVMSNGGNVSAFGAKSRFSAIYRDFGFAEAAQNIKESLHGDLISFEFINKVNPQTLFVLDRNLVVKKGQSHTKEEFNNSLVNATQAYKQQRIKYLNMDAWYLSIYGVQATQQMIRDIQQTLHMHN